MWEIVWLLVRMWKVVHALKESLYILPTETRGQRLGQKLLTYELLQGEGVGWRPGDKVQSLSTQQAGLSSAAMCCCGKEAVVSVISISVPHSSVPYHEPWPENLLSNESLISLATSVYQVKSMMHKLFGRIQQCSKGRT